MKTGSRIPHGSRVYLGTLRTLGFPLRLLPNPEWWLTWGRNIDNEGAEYRVEAILGFYWAIIVGVGLSLILRRGEEVIALQSSEPTIRYAATLGI